MPTSSSLLDRFGGNRIVLALSFARLGDAVGNSILFIILPLYVAALPAPAFPLPETVRVGILISMYGLVNTFLQPVMGAVSDRFGRRKPIILAGLLIMSSSTLAFAAAHRFTDLLILRSVQGLGVAMTIAASMALMAEATENRTRGASMGIYSTMRMGGFAVGPILGGWLHDRLGMNSAFYAGSIFILLGAVLVQLWVRERKASTDLVRPAFRIIDPTLLSPGILGTGLATFVMAASFSMMVTLEKQFNERLSQTALGFGVAFSALMVSRLLLQVPLGALSDRIGRKPLIIAGLVFMAPATALLGEVTSTLQLTLLRLGQGAASAAIAAPAFAVAADLSRVGGAGRQMTVVTMGFSLGLTLGPLLAGTLALHSFEMPFLVGGALSLIAAGVVLRVVPETLRRDSTTV